MAKTPKNDGLSYAELAKRAKKVHLVGADYKPGKLTRGQKSHLTKLYSTNRAIIKKPDDFHIRKLSSKALERLKESDHHIVNGRLYLKKSSKEEKLHIKSREKYLVIDTFRVFEGRKVRTTEGAKTIIHDDPLHIYKQLEGIEKKLASIGTEIGDQAGPYAAITVRIGKNAPFNYAASTIDELREYLSKLRMRFEVTEGPNKTDGLFRYMTLHKISWDDLDL